MELNSNNLVIRSMREADINQVTSIHCDSFPNSRSTRLGVSFVRKMYFWFYKKQPALAFVALYDNRPIGFVTGAIGGSSRKIFRYALPEVIFGFLRSPGLFLQLEMFEAWQSYLVGFFPKSQVTTQHTDENNNSVKAVLASIAVSPSGRGKKAGKALVSAFEDAAQKQGANILALGVEFDNSAARRLYESCGWVLTREDIASNSANYTKMI
jgi:ribosomal protein S18 acetylase RimI-like enzyme